MQSELMKVEALQDNLGTVSRSLADLNQKYDEFEGKVIWCKKEIEKEMGAIKRLLEGSSKLEDSHIFTKTSLKRISKLFEEMREADYQLSKYRYHRNKAQARMIAIQREMSKVPELVELYHNSR